LRAPAPTSESPSTLGVLRKKWRIGGTIIACLLFGAATALQFQLPALGVAVPNALPIMLPYLLALLDVGGLVGRRMAPATLGEPYRRWAFPEVAILDVPVPNG
jgi:ABC-type uncharacterized transport system permease subunit